MSRGVKCSGETKDLAQFLDEVALSEKWKYNQIKASLEVKSWGHSLAEVKSWGIQIGLLKASLRKAQIKLQIQEIPI